MNTYIKSVHRHTNMVKKSYEELDDAVTFQFPSFFSISVLVCFLLVILYLDRFAKLTFRTGKCSIAGICFGMAFSGQEGL